MTDGLEKRPAQGVDKTGEFFNVGAPLHAVRPGYVRRDADELLFKTVVAGHNAHVIAPDRSGKSSLIASVSARLQSNGFKIAVLDLAQIGERDGGSDAGRWYYSIAYRLCRQLRLKTDLQMWWQDHSILSNRQRLVEFYAQVVLKNVDENIIVFVDGVQHVADLPFNEQLLASIRAAHNARTTEPEFNRIGFVTVGDCDPHSLVHDAAMSPFIVSTEIRLHDFTRDDLKVFAPELNLPPTMAEQALDRVFHWTSGQPYLTQKVARAISREQISTEIVAAVDRIVLHRLAGRSAVSSEPHLSQLQRLMLNDKKSFEALLTLHGKIRKGIKVACDAESPLHRQLLAIGIVVADDEGNFVIRNRVYESVFTARWANENLPLRWRGPALAAGIALALLAIPFAYTQLLPKPYLRVIANSTYDLETVADAYQNLRSFPGHGAAAERMYRTVLEERALQADGRPSIREVARHAAVLPDGALLGEDLTASFWDRVASLAMREERRDDALLAALEALVATTPERRRRAASLIGRDYSQLLATIPAEPIDGTVYNAENSLLTRYRGADIKQWSALGDVLQAREPWIMSALEVTPLVRRVIVDRDGSANRIGLSVNVSHPRLDDIRLKLIAPSGRAAELDLMQASSAANDEIGIGSEQLTPLIGESLDGTWSLSLRDESTGVSGHLVGWRLSLNSQVVVESFERGIDIPDPLERSSENLWFSQDGRYAIARALQSDSARLWDLNYALAERTIAVPASETVIGLSKNAQFLVTLAQNNINLWRTSDGRKQTTLQLGAAVVDIVMSSDGAHLLVSSRSDNDTLFEVWSIESGNVVAELTVAGAPALVSIDAQATYLAVADFDRAVRVWDLPRAALLTQIDLLAQPSEIELSASGKSLGVVSGSQGISLWNVAETSAPVFEENGAGEWHIAFSASGARFIAGDQRNGMQIVRSADGSLSGPLLDTGLTDGVSKLFAFSSDESQVITAGHDDIARFWTVPAMSTLSAEEGADSAPSNAAAALGDDMVVATAIATGGERMAVGDHSGHIHIHNVDATKGNVIAKREDISFLGHRGAVLSVVFSRDGNSIASASADGTVRIWDGHSGQPKPFYGKADMTRVDRMVISPSASKLAVQNGQRVWMMDTDDGAELADIELGEVHNDLAYATDDQLFLAGESGTLRVMNADRMGSWHVRNVWRGPAPIRRLEIAETQQTIVLVDARNDVRLLNPNDGEVSEPLLTLPDAVSDIAFSPDESRVLFRTGRWIHRALVSPAGPVWTDSLRANKAANGSQLVFDEASAHDQDGDRVLLLSNDLGQLAVAELFFNYADGPALFGSRSGLLRDWTPKIRGANTTDFVREGF